MAVAESFVNEIYDYIRNQYGKNVLRLVQQDKYKQIVNKLLESASLNNGDISHTANKIIAMLRMNP